MPFQETIFNPVETTPHPIAVGYGSEAELGICAALGQ